MRVEFSRPNSAPEIVVEIGMEKGLRVLRGQLYQVERILNALLREDFCAYNTLRSFCHSERSTLCEPCQLDGGLFEGCYKLRDNYYANALLSEVEGNYIQ